MKVRENVDVIIKTYPFAPSLKSRLLSEVKEGSSVNPFFSNITGKKIDVKESLDAPSKRVGDWVVNLIRNEYNYHNSEGINYEIKMWFAQYDEGDSCKDHHHIPFTSFSFVYFVNSPKGASPLIFTTSGRKIKSEEGKVVIFPMNLMHHVPKNKCKERITLVGNAMAVRYGNS